MLEAPRPTSRLLVDALMRRVTQAGGFATIVQRGNDMAGAILLQCCERGEAKDLLEKSSDFDGHMQWRRVPPHHAADAKWPDNYCRRRSVDDPDLWWIELDIAGAARFADEIISVR